MSTSPNQIFQYSKCDVVAAVGVLKEFIDYVIFL